jgi:Cu2+-exporting ATPase
MPIVSVASSAEPASVLLDDAVEQARFTRWTAARDGTPAGAESSLRIGGMHCAACASAIEQALRRVAGVDEVRVSAAAQCASVRWNPALTRPSVLVDAIERAGYSAVPDTAAAAREMRRSESRDALWRLFVAVLCSMQVMMLAAPAYVSGPGELGTDLKRLLDWGSWLLTLPVMLFAARPFFAGAWRSLRSRRIGMDVPVALGLLVAFVASSGAAFDPGGAFGHEVYFDSLTMFVSFLLGARYLEMRARHRAETSLEHSIGRLPDAAWRENADGSVSAISALRLQPGDIVRVPVGQAFVADGVLTRGHTRADEALLSGESLPVEKAPGDPVVAGSMNVGAPVAMRVERVGADTRYEAIVALMRSARTERPAAVVAGDRWAAPFLWAVLALAAAAGAAWSVVDPSRAVWVVVSVLIVTCPCALSLAVPSALLVSATAMARRGVLLRRIDAIEGLARMQTLFVDKTGTLTDAQARGAVRMIRVDGATDESGQLLREVAASLAAWSSHPLAQALAQQVGPSRVWGELREVPGQGMRGRASDGVVWLLGRSPVAAAGNASDESDEAETWLSRDGQPMACFRVVESVRPDVAAALDALRRDGVRVALLSGDAPGRVERIGRLLGVTDCRGGLTPHDKLLAVREAQAHGQSVAMIGDGINDAPVLAQADTSLAMGEGAQIARAQADGVLVSGALRDVVHARALAKRTLRVVRQNFVWAAGYNAACIPLALLGWLPPWAAGLGMASSSLVVVFNSLRLAR